MTNPTNKLYALLLAFILLLNFSGFSQEVEKDKTFRLYKKKHFFYLNVSTMSGGSLYEIKGGENEYLIDVFTGSAGSQIYFDKKEDKKTKIGLDIEYLNYSFSFFVFKTGMSFSFARPGIVISRNFKKEGKGIDFKINGGATVSALREKGLFSKSISRNSFGWSLTSTLQFRTDRFVYGFFYQFSDLDADQMAFHHRINFLFGLKL